MKSILIALFLFPFSLFAQRDVATLNVGIKYAERLSFQVNEQGFVGIYYKTPDAYNFKLLNKQGSEIYSKKINRTIVNLQLLGTEISESGFGFYFQDAEDLNERKYSYINLPIDSGDFGIKPDLSLLSPNETKFKSYHKNGKLWVTCISKKEKKLIFRQYSKGEVYKTATFILDKVTLSYMKERKIKIIKPEKEYFINDLIADNKMYLTDSNKVVFSIDKGKGVEYGDTRLLQFDLETGKLTTSNIAREGEYIYWHSSFFHRDKLYRIILDPQFVKLTIWNTITGKPVKSYMYHKGTPIGIACSKIISEGERDFLGFGKENVEIEKVNRMYRKLGEGKPAIGVRSYNDSILSIIIGSLAVKTSGGGGFMYTGTSTMMTPMGPITTSNPTGYSNFPGYENTTWFSTYMNENSSAIVYDNSINTDHEKIENFKENVSTSIFRKMDFEMVYFNNKLYIGYIAAKEKCLKIIELK